MTKTTPYYSRIGSLAQLEIATVFSVIVELSGIPKQKLIKNRNSHDNIDFIQCIAAVLLVKYCKLSQCELAEIFQVSQGTINNRISKYYRNIDKLPLDKQYLKDLAEQAKQILNTKLQIIKN